MKTNFKALSYEQQKKLTNRILFKFGGQNYGYEQIIALLRENPLMVGDIALNNSLSVEAPFGFIVVKAPNEVTNYFILTDLTEDEAIYEAMITQPDDTRAAAETLTFLELINRDDVRPVFDEASHENLVDTITTVIAYKTMLDDFQKAEEEAHKPPVMTFECDMHSYDEFTGETGLIKAGSILPLSLLEEVSFFDEAKALQQHIRKLKQEESLTEVEKESPCDCVMCSDLREDRSANYPEWLASLLKEKGVEKVTEGSTLRVAKKDGRNEIN